MHLHNTLLTAKIWSDRSTAFIYLLYVAMAWGCCTTLVLQIPALLVFRLTCRQSFAFSILVNIETTLLSNHCKARTGGSLCQCILLLHIWSLGPLTSILHSCWESPTVLPDGSCTRDSVLKKILHKSSWSVEIINVQVITLIEKFLH